MRWARSSSISELASMMFSGFSRVPGWQGHKFLILLLQRLGQWLAHGNAATGMGKANLGKPLCNSGLLSRINTQECTRSSGREKPDKCFGICLSGGNDRSDDLAAPEFADRCIA